MIAGILYALIASALSGASAVLSKIAVRRADPYYVCAVSNTVILLIFLAASLLEGAPAAWSGFRNGALLAGSGVSLAFSWLFFYLAVQEGLVAVVLAIQNLAVVLTLIMCTVILGEPFTLLKGAGSVCIVAAAGIMAGAAIRGEIGRAHV